MTLQSSPPMGHRALDADAIAPDGSEIRLLVTVNLEYEGGYWLVDSVGTQCLTPLFLRGA